MRITESEYRTASKWAKRRQQKSLLDIDPNIRWRNVDAIDPILQLERLIDLRVGIQRKKKCADQEIEGGAAYREAANFHSRRVTDSARGSTVGAAVKAINASQRDKHALTTTTVPLGWVVICFPTAYYPQPTPGS